MELEIKVVFVVQKYSKKVLFENEFNNQDAKKQLECLDIKI